MYFYLYVIYLSLKMASKDIYNLIMKKVFKKANWLIQQTWPPAKNPKPSNPISIAFKVLYV